MNDSAAAREKLIRDLTSMTPEQFALLLLKLESLMSKR